MISENRFPSLKILKELPKRPSGDNGNENELIAELEKARGEKDRLTERMGALFVELSHYLN